MIDPDAYSPHIKKLVMNVLRYYWPALLKPPTDDEEGCKFLSVFQTLLKATMKGKKKEIISFISMSEYDTWNESLETTKGLGTSTPAEAKTTSPPSFLMGAGA